MKRLGAIILVPAMTTSCFSSHRLSRGLLQPIAAARDANESIQLRDDDGVVFELEPNDEIGLEVSLDEIAPRDWAKIALVGESIHLTPPDGGVDLVVAYSKCTNLTAIAFEEGETVRTVVATVTGAVLVALITWLAVAMSDVRSLSGSSFAMF